MAAVRVFGVACCSAHTTTARELFRVRSGALLIDTPGMRELALADADSGMSTTFADIDELSASCRFGDCLHAAEPGCAIRAALQRAELDPARFEAYGRLQRELAYEQRRRDERALHEHQLDVRRVQRQRVRDWRSHPKR